MSDGRPDVLLVEDDLADLELTLHSLARHGLGNQVKVVRDGEEALDFLLCRGVYNGRSLTDAPRLVLLDLKLPKVSGMEVLKTIKGDERTRSIPIVVLTSSKEEKDVLNSYQLGVNSYIQKPVDYIEFRQTVEQLGLYWLFKNEAPPVTAFSPE